MTTMLGIILQDAAPKGGILGGGMNMILLMVALFAIMYFFMIRPQQKKQKAIEKAREALKIGDRVVTAGGIHGKIKEVKERTFTVEIADGVRIKVEKTSVHPAGAQTEELAEVKDSEAK